MHDLIPLKFQDKYLKLCLSILIYFSHLIFLRAFLVKLTLFCCNNIMPQLFVNIVIPQRSYWRVNEIKFDA